MYIYMCVGLFHGRSSSWQCFCDNIGTVGNTLEIEVQIEITYKPAKVDLVKISGC